jgi:hypothetical protein
MDQWVNRLGTGSLGAMVSWWFGLIRWRGPKRQISFENAFSWFLGAADGKSDCHETVSFSQKKWSHPYRKRILDNVGSCSFLASGAGKYDAFRSGRVWEAGFIRDKEAR